MMNTIGRNVNTPLYWMNMNLDGKDQLFDFHRVYEFIKLNYKE